MRNPYPTVADYLPQKLYKPLFGDRRRWGQTADKDDPDWSAWIAAYMEFYRETQKSGVGRRVNDAGYVILRDFDLAGKTVLEIGPGALPHCRFWRGLPKHYTVVDINSEFLEVSLNILSKIGVSAEAVRSSGDRIALNDASYDVVICFYALEHLACLESFVSEISRVLRPGGSLIGGIPCEGGVAWGLGRALTSRRYVRRHFSFDPDKIICWEHPNFADEVLRCLDRHLVPQRRNFWPIGIPLIDINLICSFVYRKPDQ